MDYNPTESFWRSLRLTKVGFQLCNGKAPGDVRYPMKDRVEWRWGAIKSSSFAAASTSGRDSKIYLELLTQQ